MQSLGQQYPILSCVNVINFGMRRTIATSTTLSDGMNVLGERSLRIGYENLKNTLSLLDLGMICDASQSSAGSRVIGQRSPSRSITSSRKSLRRCVCTEDVICSFKTLQSI